MRIGGDRGRPGRTRPCGHLARQRQVRRAWRRRIAGVPVLVAVAYPARRQGRWWPAACRRGTPPQACQPLGAAAACGWQGASRHQDPTSG